MSIVFAIEFRTSISFELEWEQKPLHAKHKQKSAICMYSYNAEQ